MAFTKFCQYELSSKLAVFASSVLSYEIVLHECTVVFIKTVPKCNMKKFM